MLEMLNQAKANLRKHPSRGVPSKLSNADKLIYYRECRTRFNIAITHSISERHVCEIIKETDDVLVKNSRFHLPGKKSLLKEENHFEVMFVDVTESPLERSKKKELNYSGKKKCHTQETQIIADKSNRKMLCIAFDKGQKHNFKLFKDSKYI